MDGKDCPSISMVPPFRKTGKNNNKKKCLLSMPWHFYLIETWNKVPNSHLAPFPCDLLMSEQVRIFLMQTNLAFWVQFYSLISNAARKGESFINGS